MEDGEDVKLGCEIRVVPVCLRHGVRGVQLINQRKLRDSRWRCSKCHLAVADRDTSPLSPMQSRFRINRMVDPNCGRSVEHPAFARTHTLWQELRFLIRCRLGSTGVLWITLQQQHLDPYYRTRRN